MNASATPDCDLDQCVESLAARLANVAYAVVLRQGLRGSWIEVELGLWRSVAETIARRAEEMPSAPTPNELADWSEELVSELTRNAMSVIRQQAVGMPIGRMKSDLDLSFRQAIAEFADESAPTIA